MRNRIVLLSVLLAVSAAVATGAAAEPRRMVRRLETPRVETFSDGGEFSGVLSGTVVLNGSTYDVAPGVVIYEIGRGPVDAGSRLSPRTIWVSGIVRGSSRIVTQVIVRPESFGGGSNRITVDDGVPAGPR